MTETPLWRAALQCWQDGDSDAARRTLESLLDRQPGHIPALHLYGILLTQAGQVDEAVDCLRRVCQAQPDNDEALANLSNALYAAGDPQAAEQALRKGIALGGANPLLHFNLGNLLAATRRPAEAETEFAQACLLDPADQDAWMRLASLRYARADSLAAAAAYRQAAALGGATGAAALRLAGFALADGGRPAEAGEVLDQVMKQTAATEVDLQLLSQLLYCRLELCDWHDVADLVAQCREKLSAGAVPIEPFSFLLLAEISPAEQLALSARFCEPLLPPAGLPIPGPRPDDPVRRLRIGYLSEIFHEHATARLVTGVIEHHDHAGFEVHAFSYGPADGGDKRRRLMAACDAFHEVGGLGVQDLAEYIHGQQIDILIDLNGWTGNTCSAALAWRPAAVQVNWLGYPATLGSRQLADYLIGDPVVTPVGHQAFYAETLALMPHCYQPNDRQRAVGAIPTREAVGLPARGFVYCCFNRFLKVSPEIFDTWCEILDRVPGSVLWLLEGNPQARQHLLARAAGQGIAIDRLIFAPHLSQAEHLARLSLADLVLDTYPYGAHTTASDALWAGVPVLTRIGETFPSRVAASLLNACELSGLVTRTLTEYRDRAIELARRVEMLTELRERLVANRLSTPLFDTEAFATDFESLLRAIWEDHLCGTGNPIVGVPASRN